MRSLHSKLLRRSTLSSLAALLTLGAACSSSGHPGPPGASAARPWMARLASTLGTPVNLTAQRMTTTLRDGAAAPTWGYCESSACASATSWTPGPTIVAAAGDTLTIHLTNNLPVPTSLVVLGQLGGGLGAPQTMPSPPHGGQNHTTFPGNGPAPAPFVPPAQGSRVRSFGTEVAPGTSSTLTWENLKPG